MSSDVNSGLWVILMFQCRFIDCNKCPIVTESKLALLAAQQANKSGTRC